jgi:hypothetical protein
MTNPKIAIRPIMYIKTRYASATAKPKERADDILQVYVTKNKKIPILNIDWNFTMENFNQQPILSNPAKEN